MRNTMDRFRLFTRQAPLAMALTIGVAISGTAIAKDLSILKNEKVGKGLYEVIANDKGDLIYVTATAPANRGGEGARILEIDAKTLAIKRKINVEEAPGFGLAINNKTKTLYTTNSRTGGISAIDLKSGTIKAVVQDPETPKSHTFKVLVDEDTNTVYVSVAARPSQVWIVDGKTNAITKVIKDTGDLATGLSLDKANKKLYVSNRGKNEILVIDLKTQSVAGSFPSGGEAPMHQYFDAATNRLFVVNLTSGNLSVLDTKNNGAILKTVPTGKSALGIAYNPVNKNIYVTNRLAGTVSVINSQTYDIVSTIKTGTYPNTVSIDKKSGNAFVTNKAKSNREGPPVDDPEGDTVSIISAN